jgi:alpha-tubulin suppressor-like RCC1 family protein
LATAIWGVSPRTAKRKMSRYTWGSVVYGKLGHSIDVLEPTLDLRSNDARSSNESGIVKIPKLMDINTENPNIRFKKIICKYNSTFLIDDKGKCHYLGTTEKGTNGTGRKRGYIKTAEQVEALSNFEISDIACGNSFCLAQDVKGRLFSWGLNNYGQLGESENHAEYVPNQVQYMKNHNIVKIACGEYFAMALSDKGAVYSWGIGNNGQLGHANKSDVKVPKQINISDKIIDISCGDMHSMLLTDKGELYVFGNGRDGQVGRGDEVESSASFRTVPMKVEFFEKHGLRVSKIHAGGNHCVVSAKTF